MRIRAAIHAIIGIYKYSSPQITNSSNMLFPYAISYRESILFEIGRVVQ
jgi:hypothetical protein